MQCISLDGLDCCGKTWLIDELKKLYNPEKVRLLHLPMDQTIQKFIVTKEIKNKKQFIHHVLFEASNMIKQAYDDGIELLVLDRFLISTFLFQGNMHKPNEATNHVISNIYQDLFNFHNIDSLKDVYHYIFTNSFDIADREVSTDGKKEFDAMSDKIYEQIISMKQSLSKNNNMLKSLLFDNYEYFGYDSDKETIEEVQQKRLDIITTKIEELME